MSVFVYMYKIVFYYTCGTFSSVYSRSVMYVYEYSFEFKDVLRSWIFRFIIWMEGMCNWVPPGDSLYRGNILFYLSNKILILMHSDWTYTVHFIRFLQNLKNILSNRVYLFFWKQSRVGINDFYFFFTLRNDNKDSILENKNINHTENKFLFSILKNWYFLNFYLVFQKLYFLLFE